MSSLQFQVRQERLAATRVQSLPDSPLAQGQVRVAIDHLAYTANNITYAAFGAAMDYWRFFPVPPDADGSAWACIPAWGFGQVVQSLHPALAVGERLYGFWPTASHALLSPQRVAPQGFVDGAAHRAGLHAVYNSYQRCAADPFYTADSEPVQALLRPLFTTAWLIDDFLADNAFFGAGQAGQPALLLLSSASSKTAWATAAHLRRRPGVEVVGLTAPANTGFCERLGVYHRVLPYDHLDSLPADRPLVYVDFAGSMPLRQAVHGRFDRLAYSCSVGCTHVEQLGGGRALPGPKPVLFFAPAQVKKRQADGGAERLGRALLADWQALRAQVTAPAAPWLHIQYHQGPEAVATLHAHMLAGRTQPQDGHILSLASAAPRLAAGS